MAAVLLAVDDRHLLGAVVVLGAVSVTLTLAAMARHSVDAYGALIAPARPGR